MSTFVRFIPYFRYVYPLKNDKAINVVRLNGYSSTYQVFDLEFGGNEGVAIFRQDGQNAIVRNDDFIIFFFREKLYFLNLRFKIRQN